MDQISIYILLLVIIVCVGLVFRKSTIPMPLLLVITGMVLSFVPHFPQFTIEPKIVLEIILPLVIYEASALSSWRDFKINLRPIILLSFGHVIFITILIAVIIHALIPEFGWPMAFILGAVVSPPDDVAIIPIAEKMNLPKRIVTILKGEGMFNDATALILYRFALAAVITHEFYLMNAVSEFFLIVIGETLYGLVLGFIIGELRLRFCDTKLQMIVSLTTPFLAYLPAEILGGSGVLATIVTGLVIGQRYLHRLSPEVRLTVRSFWVMIGFLVQSILFLLIGLELRYIVDRISSIPLTNLLLYSFAVILTVIIGRFVWVYPAAYLPRFFSTSLRKKDPYPPWQYPFVISWAGMRGGVSLAAALAVPVLPLTVEGANARDLLIFLVFTVITATLVFQGLTIPWLIKVLGIQSHGLHEKYVDHLAEIKTRLIMTKAALAWLLEYRETVKDDPKLTDEVKFRIKEYRKLRTELRQQLKNHQVESDSHDSEQELREFNFITANIIDIETKELLRLWRENTISLEVRNKLMQQLDFLSKHINP
ncbi:MAG: Na+/H+ antiporter [Gammaproteobacteria bacterium]